MTQRERGAGGKTQTEQPKVLSMFMASKSIKPIRMSLKIPSY